MPKDSSVKKVLVIGSGPIVIGQAAEFDYAGAQACRVLKEEGLDVVLVNSNPATIMTDKNLANEIYLEALNAETVERVIAKEKPDALLAGLGGQTGLTIAMQLDASGALKKHGVRLLGTDVAAINRAEDRELFRDAMQAIGQPCVPSEIAESLPEAMAAAEKIGYPVIVRPAFTLGGSGGGIADTPEELETIASNGLELSPITQVLIEKCIAGWKEIEFETMRDALGNAVSVCSMENVDPVGVHTGDSIVAAPALSLTEREFTMLRQAALDIVTAIGIIGGCNCQFALKPDGSEYAVIEVNPRVSRSSALASKATGYPIAKVTTRLALGYTLSEICNPETGASLLGFEPDCQYIVVKFPKWPFDKFASSSRRLGTQMKATGEVMSIGHNFESALMKAVRGAEIGLDSLRAAPISKLSLRERLAAQDDRRIFTVFEALSAGISQEEIYDITKIDYYFLQKIQNLVDCEKRLLTEGATPEAVASARRLGYPSSAITRLTGAKELPPAKLSYKVVSTCASVFGTSHPYFYSVPEGECQARSFPHSGKPVILVLGSGPIRIGQGIEFDYSSVHCVWTLEKLGYEVVILNNNPETVSTDYDTADRLYFEPLTPEDMMQVIDVEKPVGVVVAFGGQTAIRLTACLDKAGVPILGTSAEGIDIAEDRARFDALLEQFHIRRPQGAGVATKEEALATAEKLGYPVLLRPSYVIGGQNMTISRSPEQTAAYMDKILAGGIENPVLVDRYLPGIELEVDCISDGEDVLIPGIMEHIERAGVHSGDSIAVYPPYNLTDRDTARIADVSEKLALALGTKGLVNIQYLLYEGELYVIEVNPRASRTIPYISKVTDIPMVDIAARVMLGEKLQDMGWGTGLALIPPYAAVKVPVFSFEKLNDANSILGPEMKSTGEVLGLGRTMAEALYKGLSAAGMRVPDHRQGEKHGVLLSVEESDYQDSISLAKRFFDLGFRLYATSGTAAAIETMGIPVEAVHNAAETDEIIRLMNEGKIHLVIYTGAVKDATVGDFILLHRRAMQLGIPTFTSTDTAGAMADILKGKYTAANTELVDINHMRRWRRNIHFAKLQSCANDAIFIENFDGVITSPESLCVELCAPHTGIGADGIALIEKSTVADAKMRYFNRDGSEGRMAGNNIRCAAKYLFDKGYVPRETMTIETARGVVPLRLFLRNGKVGSVAVDMGSADFASAAIPASTDAPELISYPLTVEGESWPVTCLSVGNPHAVCFTPAIDGLPLEKIGPAIEHAPLFPDRTNVEFCRVINRHTLRLRVWERGNGETMACGTGAVAAVAAAIRLGYCDEDCDILCKLSGGDLIVSSHKGRLTLTGSAVLVFEGEFAY